MRRRIWNDSPKMKCYQTRYSPTFLKYENDHSPGIIIYYQYLGRFKVKTKIPKLDIYRYWCKHLLSDNVFMNMNLKGLNDKFCKFLYYIEKMKSDFLVHLFHILFVGLFFLYIGIQRTNIPEFLYTVLIIFGIILILYHGFKVVKMKGNIINLIHALFIGPLLVYIGLKKKSTQSGFFDILIILASASIGYHSYKLLV